MNVGMDLPKTRSCEGHAEPWARKLADEGLLVGKPDFGMSFGKAAGGFLGVEDMDLLCLLRGCTARAPQGWTGTEVPRTLRQEVLSGHWDNFPVGSGGAVPGRELSSSLGSIYSRAQARLLLV